MRVRPPPEERRGPRPDRGGAHQHHVAAVEGADHVPAVGRGGEALHRGGEVVASARLDAGRAGGAAGGRAAPLPRRCRKGRRPPGAARAPRRRRLRGRAPGGELAGRGPRAVRGRVVAVPPWAAARPGGPLPRGAAGEVGGAHRGLWLRKELVLAGHPAAGGARARPHLHRRRGHRRRAAQRAPGARGIRAPGAAGAIRDLAPQPAAPPRPSRRGGAVLGHARHARARRRRARLAEGPGHGAGGRRRGPAVAGAEAAARPRPLLAPRRHGAVCGRGHRPRGRPHGRGAATRPARRARAAAGDAVDCGAPPVDAAALRRGAAAAPREPHAGAQDREPWSGVPRQREVITSSSSFP
mmetsp:Transcript_112464/g.305321  ORF Transcript_112464/g.305321 Transcript_112464/m.305321 type:complete len:354 (+) Transcript_112464:211-1272(+)